MFKLAAGVDLLHVPFRGASDAPPAVISGDVSLYFAPAASVFGHYKSGKVKAYGVAGEQRLVSMPEVPTFREQGYQDVDLPVWIGIVVPKGTPKPIREKLQSALARVLATKDISERFATFGAKPGGGSTEEFAALMSSDVRRYERLARTIGISGR
jgi:tripartite-type tricarboxylate transporter receptor subunit TctC